MNLEPMEFTLDSKVETEPSSSHWLYPRIHRPATQNIQQTKVVSRQQAIYRHEMRYEFMAEFHYLREALKRRTPYKQDFIDKFSKVMKAFGKLSEVTEFTGIAIGHAEILSGVSSAVEAIVDVSSNLRKDEHFQHAIDQVIERMDLVIPKLEIIVDEAAREASRRYSFAIHQICLNESQIRLLASVGARRMLEILITKAKDSEQGQPWEITPDLLLEGLYHGKSGQFIEGFTNKTIKAQQGRDTTAEAIYKKSGFVIIKGNNQNNFYVTERTSFTDTDIKAHGKHIRTITTGFIQLPSINELPPNKEAHCFLEPHVKAWNELKFKAKYVNARDILNYIAEIESHLDHEVRPEVINFNIWVKGWAVFKGELSGIEGNEIKLHLGDFRGVDFSRCTLKYCTIGKFSNAYLTHAKFKNVGAKNADFSGADLDCIEVEDSNFHGAILRQTKLRYAKFVRTPVCHIKDYATQYGENHLSYEKIPERCPQSQVARISLEATPRVEPITHFYNHEFINTAQSYTTQVLNQQAFYQLVETIEYGIQTGQWKYIQAIDDLIILVTETMSSSEREVLIDSIAKFIIDIKKYAAKLAQSEHKKDKQKLNLMSKAQLCIKQSYLNEYIRFIDLCIELDLSNIKQPDKYHQNYNSIIAFLDKIIKDPTNFPIPLILALWEQVYRWKSHKQLDFLEYRNDINEKLEEVEEALLKLNPDYWDLIYAHIKTQTNRMGECESASNLLIIYVSSHSLKNKPYLQVVLHEINQLIRQWLKLSQKNIQQRYGVEQYSAQVLKKISQNLPEYKVGFELQVAHNYKNQQDYYSGFVHYTQSIASYQEMLLHTDNRNNNNFYYNFLRELNGQLEEVIIFFVLNQQVNQLQMGVMPLHNKAYNDGSRKKAAILIEVFEAMVSYLLQRKTVDLYIGIQLTSIYEETASALITYFNYVKKEIKVENNTLVREVCHIIRNLTVHNEFISRDLLEEINKIASILKKIKLEENLLGEQLNVNTANLNPAIKASSLQNPFKLQETSLIPPIHQPDHLDWSKQSERYLETLNNAVKLLIPTKCVLNLLPDEPDDKHKLKANEIYLFKQEETWKYIYKAGTGKAESYDLEDIRGIKYIIRDLPKSIQDNTFAAKGEIYQEIIQLITATYHHLSLDTDEKQATQHGSQALIQAIKGVNDATKQYQHWVKKSITEIIQSCIQHLGQPPEPLCILASGQTREIGLYPGAVFPIVLLTTDTKNESYYSALIALLQARLEYIGQIIIENPHGRVPCYTPEEYIQANLETLPTLSPHRLGQAITILYDSSASSEEKTYEGELSQTYKELHQIQITTLLEKDINPQAKDFLANCLSNFDQAFNCLKALKPVLHPPTNLTEVIRQENLSPLIESNTIVEQDKIIESDTQKAEQADLRIKQPIAATYSQFTQNKVLIKPAPSNESPHETENLPPPHNAQKIQEETIPAIDIEKTCLIPLIHWCQSLGLYHGIIKSDPFEMLSLLIEKFSKQTPESESPDDTLPTIHPDFLRDVQAALVNLYQLKTQRQMALVQQYGMGYRWLDPHTTLTVESSLAHDENQATQNASQFSQPNLNEIQTAQLYNIISHVLLPAYKILNNLHEQKQLQHNADPLMDELEASIHEIIQEIYPRYCQHKAQQSANIDHNFLINKRKVLLYKTYQKRYSFENTTALQTDLSQTNKNITAYFENYIQQQFRNYIKALHQRRFHKSKQALVNDHLNMYQQLPPELRVKYRTQLAFICQEILEPYSKSCLEHIQQILNGYPDPNGISPRHQVCYRQNPLSQWQQQKMRLFIQEEKPVGDTAPIEVAWYDPISKKPVQGYLKPTIRAQLMAAEQTQFNPSYSPPQCKIDKDKENNLKQTSDRIVIPIAFRAIGPLKYYEKAIKPDAFCKQYPEDPVTQYQDQILRQHISGVVLPATLCRFKPQDKPAYSVMISQTVIEGSLLENMASKHQSNANLSIKKNDLSHIENQLDPYYFTLKFLETLLIRPEDGKFANIGIERFINHNGQPAYRLIDIDPDHAFVDLFTLEEKAQNPEVSQRIRLNVKTVLYTLSAMKQPMDPQAVNLFLNLEPNLVLSQWLEALKDYQKAYLGDHDARIFNSEEIEEIFHHQSYVGCCLEKHTLLELRHRWEQIKDTLRKMKHPITHREFFVLIEPFLSIFYLTIDERLTIKDRFEQAMSQSNYIKYIERQQKFPAGEDLRPQYCSSQTVTRRVLMGLKPSSKNGLISMRKRLEIYFESDESRALRYIHELKDKVAPIDSLIDSLKYFHQVYTQTRQHVYNVYQGRSIDWENIFYSVEFFLGCISMQGMRTYIKKQGLTKMPETAEKIFRRRQQAIIHALMARLPDNKSTKLNLSGFSYLTERQLIQLLNALPALVSLDISGCELLTDTAIIEIASLCQNLRYLNISKLPRLKKIVSSRFTQAITQQKAIRFKELTQLVAKDCCNLEMLSIDCPNLQIFHLSKAKLRKLRGNFPSLAQLMVNYCDSLKTLSIESPNLKSLQISKAKLRQLTGNWPNLVELIMHDCNLLQGGNTGSQRLQVLDITGCNKISPTMLITQLVEPTAWGSLQNVTLPENISLWESWDISRIYTEDRLLRLKLLVDTLLKSKLNKNESSNVHKIFKYYLLSLVRFFDKKYDKLLPVRVREYVFLDSGDLMKVPAVILDAFDAVVPSEQQISVVINILHQSLEDGVNTGIYIHACKFLRDAIAAGVINKHQVNEIVKYFCEIDLHEKHPGILRFVASILREALTTSMVDEKQIPQILRTLSQCLACTNHYEGSSWERDTIYSLECALICDLIDDEKLILEAIEGLCDEVNDEVSKGYDEIYFRGILITLRQFLAAKLFLDWVLGDYRLNISEAIPTDHILGSPKISKVLNLSLHGLDHSPDIQAFAHSKLIQAIAHSTLVRLCQELFNLKLHALFGLRQQKDLQLNAPVKEQDPDPTYSKANTKPTTTQPSKESTELPDKESEANKPKGTSPNQVDRSEDSTISQQDNAKGSTLNKASPLPQSTIKINQDVQYTDSMIMKILVSHWQKVHNGHFFIGVGDEANIERPSIVSDLFDGMNFKHNADAGLLLKDEKQLYTRVCHETGQETSVSICNMVNYAPIMVGGKDESMRSLEHALTQLRDWKRDYDSPQYHDIEFSYHASAVHWCTGKLQLSFDKNKNLDISGKMTIYDPLGSPPQSKLKIYASAQQRITELVQEIYEQPEFNLTLAGVPKLACGQDYQRQQHSRDGSSCGVIAVENAKDIIDGKSERLQHGIYPEGASELRQAHVQEVGEACFSAYASGQVQARTERSIIADIPLAEIKMVYPAFIKTVKQLQPIEQHQFTQAFTLLKQAIAHRLGEDDIYRYIKRLLQQHDEVFKSCTLNSGHKLLDVFFDKGTNYQSYQRGGRDLLAQISLRGIAILSSPKDDFASEFRKYFKGMSFLSDMLIVSQEEDVYLQSYAIYSLEQFCQILTEEVCNERSALGQYMEAKEREGVTKLLYENHIESEAGHDSPLFIFKIPEDICNILKKVLKTHAQGIHIAAVGLFGLPTKISSQKDLFVNNLAAQNAKNNVTEGQPGNTTQAKSTSHPSL